LGALRGEKLFDLLSTDLSFGRISVQCLGTLRGTKRDFVGWKKNFGSVEEVPFGDIFIQLPRFPSGLEKIVVV